MADSPSHSFNKTHLQDPNPTPFSSSIPTKPPKSKSLFTHYCLSKSLIIILVLLVFSFFPSQVPDFFNKTTIITKIWELIYLLVIGIAVCYGLFSRKIESVHSSDDDNINVKETYLSGISHISSIFEDGIQNPYGFDDKDLFEIGNGNGFGKSDGNKLNQYNLGESLVVINDEKYVLEQLGKPKSVKLNKPLCLPIRNLGSKSLDSGKTVKCSSSNWDEMKIGKFRGLVPIKLEDKFKESDSDSDSQTPLNWRSKSMRLEKRELFDETSQFNKPVSVGIPDFEGLKSKSMRFSMPSEKEESKGTKINRLGSKEIMKDFGKTKVGDSKEEISDSSNSILKPTPVYKRGKSVRTSKPKEQILEAKVNTFPSQSDDKVETRSRNVKLDEGGIASENLSDTEPHSGEVDRKADEFIAKFREQIRLQKVASARKLNLW